MAMMIDNCEAIFLSLDSHKAVPAPFLTKTYQLVDDPTTDHIVSWGEDDTTFVVWRPPEFARDLLPNYFKHNNFSSFVRQLNTYGFRKIVPDRWEFANDFFRRGEKHLLCEIHRRKTCQPQVGINYQPIGGPAFFPYQNRDSISTSDSDEQANNWSDSPPVSSPSGRNGVSGISSGGGGGCNNSSSVTALSKDNERLRRSNNMLMSELAHMRKLYNDIIYFVQNHVQPVTPSNSYPSSRLLCNSSPASSTPTNPISTLMGQKPLNHFIGSQQQAHAKLVPQGMTSFNSPGKTSQCTVTMLEEVPENNSSRTKLFGVPIQSKKRLHPEYGFSLANMETTKARLVMEKDELGLNLMPPFPC